MKKITYRVNGKNLADWQIVAMAKKERVKAMYAYKKAMTQAMLPRLSTGK